MEQLQDKVAFITGGASGIGLGIAKAFVNTGMRVVLADHDREFLDEALAMFQQQGCASRVHGVEFDVTDRVAFSHAAEEAERVFGKIHVLCNNAGIGISGPIKAASFGDWDWALGVMIGGVINGIQTILPRILRHGEGGHIVTTSSMAGVLPVSKCSIYCTGKAAVLGMCEAIRGELSKDNIGVSAFCPGPVATNMGKIGRHRHDIFKENSGYGEFEGASERFPTSSRWMSIDECGERVLEGIRRNDLYIFTHPEFSEGVAERMEAMLASFPDEEPDELLAKEISFLTSNPIFRQVLRSRMRVAPL
jgi:NAD(P)-dependent dehydrogenase (short-subunit alcohol dehydrogenase family)